MSLLRVEIPLKLPSIANSRMHWRPKAKLIASHREAVRMAMRSFKHRHALLECAAATTRGDTLEVTLTRIALRPIRDVFENLPMCFKGVVDQLAKELGVDDSLLDIKKPRQERGPYGVRIEVVPAMLAGGL